MLANAATGLVAALVLARGELVAAAVLLQLKTLLDNADGQLARATGRVTLAGRYLDTDADLVVNAAVFAALGYVTGRPVLALAGFVALTLVLAADFNATKLYRAGARGADGHTRPPTGASSRAHPHARSTRAARSRRLDRALARARSRAASARAEAATTAFTVTALANLGLSTQLACSACVSRSEHRVRTSGSCSPASPRSSRCSSARSGGRVRRRRAA